ncbi:MAG: methionine--tRNA ligase [Bacillota bacterium]|jgi:methionyl-tRNA synthetase
MSRSIRVREALLLRKTYYITTPIYYASGDLHIGHSYTTLAADAISRYKRLRGYEVFFLTGTDEHGLKIQRKAESVGLEPKEFVDGIVAKIKDLWRVLDVRYDGFIRTTDDEHKRTVQWVFKQLYDNGDIYKRNYESWYCVGCESFYTETQARSFPEMVCPDHGKPLERVKEESYFFRLSKYADRLLRHIEENPDFIQPVSRRNEVVQFVKMGLEDLCISRTTFRWGIPVPFDPGSVVYVWIDALTNYISAMGYPFDMERFEKWWPADVHLIGKEILRFHAVIWPILLMALDLPLPKQVFAHGWLNLGGKKMSKTMGNVVDPIELSRKYSLDAVRYFVLREVPFGADGDYTEEALVARINSDLANDLGNLVYRTLTMVRRFTESRVPEPGREEPVDKEFKDRCLALKQAVEEEMDRLRLSSALERVMDVVGKANKYIDEVSPWDLAKNDASRLGTALYYLCEGLRITASVLRPFLVNTPSLIWSALGMPESMDNYSWDSAGDWGIVRPGQVTRRGKPLFPRIEFEDATDGSDAESAEVSAKRKAAGEAGTEAVGSQAGRGKERGLAERAGGQTGTKEAVAVAQDKLSQGADMQVGASQKDEANVITIDQFRQVELRVAQVLSAEKVQGADKLLRLKVSLGDEERQIVAGIAQHYDPQELVGKQIVIAYNLKPAVIRGVESKGMLLASKDDETLAVLTVDRKVKNGSPVS